jgi:hypothetical protein
VSFFQQITTNSNSETHSTLEMDERGRALYDETVRRFLSNHRTAMASADSNENRQPTASGHREEGLSLEITWKTWNGEPSIVGKFHMKDGENNVVLVGKKPVSIANEFCVTLTGGDDEEMPDNFLKLVLLKGNDATKFRLEVTFLHGKPGDLLYFLSGQSFDIGKSMSVHVGELQDNSIGSQPVATVATSTRYAMPDDSSSEDEDEESPPTPDDSSSEDVESPPKSVRKTWNDAAMDVDQDNDDDDDDSDNKFYDTDAHPDPKELDEDVEASLPDDENLKPPAKNLHGITLSFVDGPLKGRVFHMIKGENETVIVGSDPVPKANGTVLEIADDALGASHVKLQIEVQRKKHWRLQVTDLKPKNGGTTAIGEYAIPSGKARVAMPGQYIQFGETKVLVLAYKGAKADNAVAEPERSPTRSKRIVAASIDNSPQVVVEDTKPSPMKLVNKNATRERTPTRRKRSVAAANDNSPQVVEDTKPAPMKVANKNATARLVVTNGPHKDEEYFLGKGGSEKILFGSKPSTKAKNVDTISLPLDTNMQANHARLDFVGSKRCMKIKVTNVSAGGHTFVGADPVSKDRVAFSGQTITIGDTVMRVESVSD